MLKNNTATLLTLFLIQVLLCVYGNFIFLNRVNPFVLLAVSLSLAYHAYLLLKKQPNPDYSTPNNWKWPLIHGLTVVLLIVATGPELNRIWGQLYPDPGKVSDVIPQLKGQADLFFSGQFPYVPIETVSHRPYPVYLPLQWMPFQLSNLLGADARFIGVLLLCIGLLIAVFVLKRQYGQVPNSISLPEFRRGGHLLVPVVSGWAGIPILATCCGWDYWRGIVPLFFFVLAAPVRCAALVVPTQKVFLLDLGKRYCSRIVVVRVAFFGQRPYHFTKNERTLRQL
jgi:hypothetical protein